MKRALVLLVGLAGCTSEKPALHAATDDRAADSAAITAPSDSLVGRAGPYTFWFTLARPATSASGAACVERGLEVRTDTSRRLVPLLYTREAPVSETDSTVTLHLSERCAPGPLYRVNLRTGQPVPVRR